MRTIRGRRNATKPRVPGAPAVDRVPRRVVKRNVMPPTIQECHDYAWEALSKDPSHSHIERAPLLGHRVAHFAIPDLSLMPSGNPWGRLKSWQKAKMIEQLRDIMAPQLLRFHLLALPLSGRPMIRAIRFSSTEGDADSGWTKLVIDRLTVRSKGFGIIEDDKPSKLNLKAWWEYAPRGMGFGYFELWSGER